jgi:hypothetical protein
LFLSGISPFARNKRFMPFGRANCDQCMIF